MLVLTYFQKDSNVFSNKIYKNALKYILQMGHDGTIKL